MLWKQNWGKDGLSLSEKQNLYFLSFFFSLSVSLCTYKRLPRCYILDLGWFSNVLLTNCLWTLFSLPWRSEIHQSEDLITQAQARHTVRTCSICYLALPMHINLSWLKTALYQRQTSAKGSQIIFIGPWLRSADPTCWWELGSHRDPGSWNKTRNTKTSVLLENLI